MTKSQQATALVNLVVDLGAVQPGPANELPAKADVLRAIESAGFTLRELPPGTDDAALAWIDEEFGGSWSSEAFAGTTTVAYDREKKHAGFVTYDPQGLCFRWLGGAAMEPGTGIFGPIGVVSHHRKITTESELTVTAESERTLGQNLLVLALSKLRERGYTRALIPAVGDQRLIAYYERHANAHVIEEFDRTEWFNKLIPTVVMASGNGSNFQAVVDRVSRGALPLRINAVVCNSANAYALERARKAGTATRTVVWDRKNETREAFDARLVETLEELQPKLVLLLGWMHVLPQTFIEKFPDAINIHPAFLPLDQSKDEVALPDGTVQPAFRGPHSADDAVEAGTTWIGATTHRLSLGADRGPILIRKPISVADLHGNRDAILQRLHAIEHDVVAASVRRAIYEWR